MSKQALRSELLKKRNKINQTNWQEKSEQICRNLELLDIFIKSKTICSYFSFRKEVDLLPLTINNLDKKWAFPRCVAQNLIWHWWTPKDELKKGNYGIREPDYNLPIITSQEVDLILIPSVACDIYGYRLGYGGGYYDRMLAQSSWKNIPTIGIIFECFYLSALPRDIWDIKLDYICTENGIYKL
jgi:5-formyltetrahydrofolate cyclo-ligase